MATRNRDHRKQSFRSSRVRARHRYDSRVISDQRRLPASQVVLPDSLRIPRRCARGIALDAIECLYAGIFTMLRHPFATPHCLSLVRLPARRSPFAASQCSHRNRPVAASARRLPDTSNYPPVRDMTRSRASACQCAFSTHSRRSTPRFSGVADPRHCPRPEGSTQPGMGVAVMEMEASFRTSLRTK